MGGPDAGLRSQDLGEERVLAGGVVGYVDHLDDFGNMVLDRRLDSLPQSHGRQPAALAPAAELHKCPIAIDLGESHKSTVSCDCRVDVHLYELLDPFFDRTFELYVTFCDWRGCRVGVAQHQPGCRRVAGKVEDRTPKIIEILRWYGHGEPTVILNVILLAHIGAAQEGCLIDEAVGADAGDAQTKMQIRD